MKRFIFAISFILFFFCENSFAQTQGGVGLKGGLNYNSAGNYFKDAGLVWGNPFNNMGFHVGTFAKINLGPLFLRPELVFTQINSDINQNTFKTQRLDVPALVGVNLLGSLVSVFAGPSFHYYMVDELREFDFEKFDRGYQFGVGVNLRSVGLDLRYERVVNNQTIQIEDIISGNGDFKSQQIILGLSFKF